MKSILKENRFFLMTVILVILLRVFVFRTVIVLGHSMDEILAEGQWTIAVKHASYEHQDRVILTEPDQPEKEAVKRVIGLPGDKVSMKDDRFTVNGQEIPENYLSAYQKAFEKDRLQGNYAYNEDYQDLAQQAETFTNDFEVTVPEDAYFVLGDNRLISKDSRIFGMVPKDYMQGKLVLRVWPLNKLSLF